MTESYTLYDNIEPGDIVYATSFYSFGRGYIDGVWLLVQEPIPEQQAFICLVIDADDPTDEIDNEDEGYVVPDDMVPDEIWVKLAVRRLVGEEACNDG